MFSIPDANAREAPTGRVTRQTTRLLAANGPPTPYRLDLVAREQSASQQVRPQETGEELTLAPSDQDAHEQGLTLAVGQADPDNQGQLLIGGGGKRKEHPRVKVRLKHKLGPQQRYVCNSWRLGLKQHQKTYTKKCD
jgi:hypothetical protein